MNSDYTSHDQRLDIDPFEEKEEGNENENESE